MQKPDSSSTRGARRVGRSPRPRRREASRRPERSGARRGPTPRPRGGRGRAYDSNGNPTSVSQNTGWRFSSLAYDNANRLRQIVSSKTDNYWYNHVGLRVKKTEDATGTWQTTYTLFAGNNPLLQETYNASGRLQTTFNVIVDDKILAQYKKVYPATTSKMYFYVDHLNSRRVVFNSTPAVVDRYRYSAWGVVTQDLGTDALASYTGKDYDATGLIYFNARSYDPLTGRFLTEDPSRNGGNWYSYCENSPVNYTDPTGLMTGDEYAAFYANQNGSKVTVDNKGNVGTSAKSERESANPGYSSRTNLSVTREKLEKVSKDTAKASSLGMGIRREVPYQLRPSLAAFVELQGFVSAEWMTDAMRGLAKSGATVEVKDYPVVLRVMAPEQGRKDEFSGKMATELNGKVYYVDALQGFDINDDGFIDFSKPSR